MSVKIGFGIAASLLISSASIAKTFDVDCRYSVTEPTNGTTNWKGFQVKLVDDKPVVFSLGTAGGYDLSATLAGIQNDRVSTRVNVVSVARSKNNQQEALAWAFMSKDVPLSFAVSVSESPKTMVWLNCKQP